MHALTCPVRQPSFLQCLVDPVESSHSLNSFWIIQYIVLIVQYWHYILCNHVRRTQRQQACGKGISRMPAFFFSSLEQAICLHSPSSEGAFLTELFRYRCFNYGTLILCDDPALELLWDPPLFPIRVTDRVKLTA